MSADVLAAPDANIEYPSSDGMPLAETSLQYEWIVTFRENINWLLHDAEAFVGADNFWYPVQGHAEITQAPDVYVALGRPKGHRPSYKQWEEGGVAPQVAIEVWGLTNTREGMRRKREWYARYGVEEYYEYDPVRDTIKVFVRAGDELVRVSDLKTWVSPRLGIRFDDTREPVVVIGPGGRPFQTVEEIQAERDTLAERAQQEGERAERERQRADDAERRLAALYAKMRAAGVEPNGEADR